MLQSVNPRQQGSDDLDEFLNDNQDEWQVTFLDTMTILLTFFIFLASVADTNSGKLVSTDVPEDQEQQDTKKQQASGQSDLFFPIEALNYDLSQLLEQEIADGTVVLEKGKYDIRMSFSGSSFYASGEADLLPGGKKIIERIVGELSGLPRDDFKLDVEGHTDGTPISTLKFNNNWELSAARAANVVSYFLQAGVPAEKLKASGYADAFPLYPERDENGKVNFDNQRKNRRIVIRLYYN